MCIKSMKLPHRITSFHPRFYLSPFQLRFWGHAISLIFQLTYDRTIRKIFADGGCHSLTPDPGTLTSWLFKIIFTAFKIKTHKKDKGTEH